MISATLCGKDEETYKYIFVECDMVKDLWEQRGHILDLPISKEIGWKEVHIGVDEITGSGQIINPGVLLIK